MTSLDDHLDPPVDDDSGCELLLQLVSAVTHLRRGLQPRLTAWEVLGSEGIDPDVTAPQVDSLRQWLISTARIYNEGHPWPAATWGDSLEQID